MQGARRHFPQVVVVVTPAEVREIAETVEALPENFDPATWLEENRADIVIVATEAVKDVVFEALEFGLFDHPLVLQRRTADDGMDCC
jgi:hypothetical protein